jgi:hypothetical protein
MALPNRWGALWISYRAIAFLGALAGCKGQVPAAALARAPSDLSCPAESIGWDSSQGFSDRYRAEGCGRWLVYQCLYPGKSLERMCFPDAPPVPHATDAGSE